MRVFVDVVGSWWLVRIEMCWKRKNVFICSWIYSHFWFLQFMSAQNIWMSRLWKGKVVNRTLQNPEVRLILEATSSVSPPGRGRGGGRPTGRRASRHWSLKIQTNRQTFWPQGQNTVDGWRGSPTRYPSLRDSCFATFLATTSKCPRSWKTGNKRR